MLCYVCYVEDIQSYGSVVQLWRSLCGRYVLNDIVLIRYTIPNPSIEPKTINTTECVTCYA